MATAAETGVQNQSAVAGTSIGDPLAIIRLVLYGILLFVVVCLAIDSLVIRKRGVSRLATHSFAHIAVIVVISLVTLLFTSGKIL